MSSSLSVAPVEQIRAELRVDLRRAGYVFQPQDGTFDRFFEKYQVLSRPGLVARSARFLAALLPSDCERVAATGIGSAVLASAIAAETGVLLLLASDRNGPDQIAFAGEPFPGMRTVLLEDVVHTGSRAVAGADALRSSGADVLGVICLLDRAAGSAGRLAQAGYTLRSVFTEADLLEQT
jgi:orotate phosphoribosyltransferase